MRTRWASLGMVLGVVALTIPATALQLTTNAEFVAIPQAFGGSIDDQDGLNSANSGNISSQVDFGGPYFGGEVFFESDGRAFSSASDAGTIFSSASFNNYGETSAMDFHASSSWSDTFTNNSGGALNYDFDFLFDGGLLALGGDGGTAMFSLDILLNGTSIWNRSASLTGDPSSGIADLLNNGGLDADGLVHSISFDQNDDYVEVQFADFVGNLNLGSFDDGESFEVTYNLDAWASTTGSFGSVRAFASDPFGVGFQGFVAPSTSAPVPEPASMLLLSMGLFGMGARHLRKKNQ